jgi:hypothetical protein
MPQNIGRNNTKKRSCSCCTLFYFDLSPPAGVCVGAGCNMSQIGPRTYVGVDMSDAGLQPDGVTVKPGIASYPAVMAELFPGE